MQTSQLSTNDNAGMSTVSPINTVLVANRGEIACRVINTAKRLGKRTVAIYSDVDSHARHVQLADHAVCVGGAAATDSYLNIDRIIVAATQNNVDAIHPGYGFLSENAEFVDACVAAGIVFMGPDASAIRAMGLKDAAKALMEDAGVAVVPGYHGERNDAKFLLDKAAEIGYPILIKARAGGGGKGMRRVDAADDFVDALTSAQREAQASFTDDAVLIEKFIETPRHIEVQVFGDRHGNVVHLYERDCSLQRRHQKVLEESPAPGMSAAMRDAMTSAAIRAARAVNYVGAGTVEFIVSAENELQPDHFWFMEMNTRLQVEHPVTEAVTGIDLVEWQFLVAEGHVLPCKQDAIALNGHAVEVRLYAEDPQNNFMPATGRLQRLRFSEQGRIDTGVVEGDEVLPYYDPMLAKLIAYQPNRKAALFQLKAMLDESVVLGTLTNRQFLSALCAHDSVMLEQLDTGLIERDADVLCALGETDTRALAVCALVCAAHPESEYMSAKIEPPNFPISTLAHSITEQVGLFELWANPRRQVVLTQADQVHQMQVERAGRCEWRVWLDGQETTLEIDDVRALVHGADITVNDQHYSATVFYREGQVGAQLDGESVLLSLPSVEQSLHGGRSALSLNANMPGRVIAVHCAAGDTIEAGAPLITLEAMKMEHSLSAADTHVIEKVLVREGEQVAHGAELVRFIVAKMGEEAKQNAAG